MSLSILEDVQSGKSPRPIIGVLYGTHGVGKSTFAANTPDHIIIDCENGLGRLDCRRTPYLSSYMVIKEWLDALITDPHEYKTVIIDTLDWMMRRIEEEVTGSGSNLTATLNKAQGGYGNGKKVLINYVFGEVIPTLNKLSQKGINVIMLAHACQRDVVDADGITVTKTAPDVAQDFVMPFLEWSDFVGLCRVDDGTRWIQMVESETVVAKNRLGIEKGIPMEWTALEEAANNG